MLLSSLNWICDLTFKRKLVRKKRSKCYKIVDVYTQLVPWAVHAEAAKSMLEPGKHK
jgi:hypothetical protein